MVAPRVCSYVYNAGTAKERVATQQFVPLHRRLLADPKDIVRAFNLYTEEVATATIDARSRPPRVTLVAVSFSNGSRVTLAHRLGTSSIVWWLASPSFLSAGAPYATSTAIDSSNITLLSAGTFTADIIMEIRP